MINSAMDRQVHLAHHSRSITAVFFGGHGSLDNRANKSSNKIGADFDKMTFLALEIP
jgi:hypothetical protein